MAGNARDLIQRLQAGTISRREFMVRALAMDVSFSAVGTVLQACGTAPNSPNTAGQASVSAAPVAEASSEPTPQPTLEVKANAFVQGISTTGMKG